MLKLLPFLDWIGEVNARSLRLDFLAGITGAIVVLPQGVAFAMIAGLPPIHGLYTAMILPIVAALFGSSRHLISGPTTAISIVVFSTVSQYAVPGTPDFVTMAIVVTLVTGLMQLALGLVQLGALINFVSHSVVIGFTSGAAILIGISQLKHIFGITVPQGATSYQSIITITTNIDQTNFHVLAVGLTTLVAAILIRRIHSLAPHMLIAMIGSSMLAFYFGNDVGIVTVGELPSALPSFAIPKINFEQFIGIFPNAFAIALLGLIEAVAIGRSIATKSGQRINGSQEFIGQGLSNIVGSFFSCYAGSGSFTRSGVNYSTGAVTPMSAIFAAVLLMMVISFIAPLAAYLPIASMGGIILLVAYNLIDFVHIKKILFTSKRESTVLSITFLSTLFLELEFAIYFGVFFSLFFYLNQTSHPRFVKLAPDHSTHRRRFLNLEKHQLDPCPQLMIYRIEGSLFFGAVEDVSEKMDKLFQQPEKNLLIVGNNINLIDTAGADSLVEASKKWTASSEQIYFCGFKQRAGEFLKRGGFWNEIGRGHFFDNKEEAIKKIYPRLSMDICKSCTAKIFTECNG